MTPPYTIENQITSAYNPNSEIKNLVGFSRIPSLIVMEFFSFLLFLFWGYLSFSLSVIS